MEEPSPFAHDQRHAVQAVWGHLAWGEMRLIIAKLVWTFDVEFKGKPLNWADLRTSLLVEKKPVEVRLRMRKM